MIEVLKTIKEPAIDVLRQRFKAPNLAAAQRLHAAMALAAFGQVESEYLVNSIPTLPDDECPNLIRALNRDHDPAVQELQSRWTALAEKPNEKAQARVAIVLWHLGDVQRAQQMCGSGEDPEPRLQ